ncbi:hypothetical protein AX14_001263 [Amanita brunnescens Koide BX004]|nr:hypothetical protein AX14_001263 [Amanita brunnescens Koide BX004]
MDLHTGPPPGLTRPKTSPPPPISSPTKPSVPSHHNFASPVPRRATTVPWASSLTTGLFPAASPLFPPPPQVPRGLLSPVAAVQSAVELHNNDQISDLGTGLPLPAASDPWHRAHVRVCAHAITPCAACSVALFCCTCRALRFTPGPAPVSPSESTAPHQRTWSVSPVLFRSNVGNGTPPPGFDSYDNDDHDDDAYIRALAETDTCDNSSCPRGGDEPATYTITVEHFDEELEETYNCDFRACSACNRSCKKSFMGHRIKARVFDNSTREALASRAERPAGTTRTYTDKLIGNSAAATDPLRNPIPGSAAYARQHPADIVTTENNDTLGSHNIKSRTFDNSTGERPAKRKQVDPIPGSALHAQEHPTNADECEADPRSLPAPLDLQATSAFSVNHDTPYTSSDDITALQSSLRILNDRPSTPATFVAVVRVKHDALCQHAVDSCPVCSLGLTCCLCHVIFAPAAARHLACANCKHVAGACCTTPFCCKCSKIWLPTDSIDPVRFPARRFFGGAGSASNITSSPEPDIWTPSPRSSPDEIDDLTARAALPLPASRSESDASRAPSRASSVDEPVNMAATPLPTPDYSSLQDELVEGFVHPSFPERAILDNKDKRHFLGRGDLSVTSLKLYARRIFTDTTHWITAGHFLVDIFHGSTIHGSRDDFRRFVILIGTQLGFGDLAQSMSESLDVNRKMADEYMRLRDVATTWKQKAKLNSKDAKDGRKARDELQKARGDISSILEERDVFITQRNELLADIKRLNLELSRVHKDYGNAIDDNAKFAADLDSLKEQFKMAKSQLNHANNALSMAEHHRNKAEFDHEQAVLNFNKAVADNARDKAFYEARITALSSPPVPTSQLDTEIPVKASDAERAVLLTRIENLKKELSNCDAELARLRSETSLSSDVNTLRTELAEAKAVSARLSGMYEQKSKDFRESELERLSLLGKQILADGEAPKVTPPARPRPDSRRGRRRSRSANRADQPVQNNNERDKGPKSPVSSQPFWQDEPLFTKHVAAVTTATMSALPHLPFETAIATAFTTVRNVGPPPPLKLDKKPGASRSNAPSPQTAQSPPEPPRSNFTFADIAKAAAASTDGANKGKKPSWRAIETSKSLVLRPSTKGTRVSELHLKIPKTSESADLFRLKGTALLERVAKLINDHSEPAPRMALRENPLVFVKWSMKGNLVLKCTKPMDDTIKDGIKDALTNFSRHRPPKF